MCPNWLAVLAEILVLTLKRVRPIDARESAPVHCCIDKTTAVVVSRDLLNCCTVVRGFQRYTMSVVSLEQIEQ